MNSVHRFENKFDWGVLGGKKLMIKKKTYFYDLRRIIQQLHDFSKL